MRAVALDLAPLMTELDFSIETAPAPVRGHEWALRELVRNLLHNAIRQSPPGATLSVSLVTDGRHAALTVGDAGPGIGAAQRERLFQPFSGGAGVPEPHSGSGLGLAICHEIVDSLGGTLSLDNRLVHGPDHRAGRHRPAAAGRQSAGMNALPLVDRLRLDKWLWAARLYKTRALAAGEVDRGRVRVNGQDAKPGRELKAGDRIELRQEALWRALDVLALSTVRGPAPLARTLYEETSKAWKPAARPPRRAAWPPSRR